MESVLEVDQNRAQLVEEIPWFSMACERRVAPDCLRCFPVSRTYLRRRVHLLCSAGSVR